MPTCAPISASVRLRRLPDEPAPEAKRGRKRYQVQGQLGQGGMGRVLLVADRDLKRAGLDYWDKVFLKLFPNWAAYLAEFPDARRVLFTANVEWRPASLYDVHFSPGDHLVFGSETQGLPPDILGSEAGQKATIPMLPQRRSLNLSTAVGIAAYEALRQLARPLGASLEGASVGD